MRDKVVKRIALLYEADCSFLKAITPPNDDRFLLPKRRKSSFHLSDSLDATPSFPLQTYHCIGGYRIDAFKGNTDCAYLAEIWQDERATLPVTLDWEVQALAQHIAETMYREGLSEWERG